MEDRKEEAVRMETGNSAEVGGWKETAVVWAKGKMFRTEGGDTMSQVISRHKPGWFEREVCWGYQG